MAGLVVVPHPTPDCPRFSVEYKPEWLDPKARPPPEDQQSQQVHALAAVWLAEFVLFLGRVHTSLGPLFFSCFR